MAGKNSLGKLLVAESYPEHISVKVIDLCVAERSGANQRNLTFPYSCFIVKVVWKLNYKYLYAYDKPKRFYNNSFNNFNHCFGWGIRICGFSQNANFDLK